jgi:hypothetical protein
LDIDLLWHCPTNSKTFLRRLLCQEEEEAVVRSHQSVDWLAYYKSIAKECPWSLRAYQQGLIDLQDWRDSKSIPPLDHYHARVWHVPYPDTVVEAMAEELDSIDPIHEWLFSYPGYGEYATPIPVLIQQNRQQLNQIRDKIA